MKRIIVVYSLMSPTSLFLIKTAMSYVTFYEIQKKRSFSERWWLTLSSEMGLDKTLNYGHIVSNIVYPLTFLRELFGYIPSTRFASCILLHLLHWSLIALRVARYSIATSYWLLSSRLKMLFADYYIWMVFNIMPVSLIFCQKFLCAVPASEGARLIFRHLSGNINRRW